MQDVATAARMLLTPRAGDSRSSTHVYWTANGSGLIVKAPKAGGTQTTIASGQSAPFGIAQDAVAVYWANSGNGTVVKLAK